MEHTLNKKPRKQVRWQDIHNRMTRRGLPAHLVAAAVEAFRERGGDRKRQSLFAYHHRIGWAKLLRPLMYELDSVRTGLTYSRTHTPDNTQKLEALQAYIVVLEELHMRMTAHRDDMASTPRQLAREYNAEHKRRGKGFFVPNNGVHWTDWIPRHITMRVSDMFLYAPRAPRSKPRLPFLRTMPPVLQSAAVLELRKRCENELGRAQQLHDINPTDKGAQKIADILRALHILDTMKRNEFVPDTWQALLAGRGELSEETTD